MNIGKLSDGQLVRSNIKGPAFHRGTLFQVTACRTRGFVACKAVGLAPFKIWYFRPEELEPASVRLSTFQNGDHPGSRFSGAY